MYKSIRSFRSVGVLFVVTAVVGLGLSHSLRGQQPPSKKPVSVKSDSSIALVELFTSQGCSSCPSADENLAAIAKQADKDGKQVITLSFHVDYWNYLGWKDPYSSADATKRQRLYATVHGSKQVYTPQMVVNGTKELLGSSREKSKGAILAALKKQPRSSIQLQTKSDGRQLHVDWKIEGLEPTDLVNVALVQDHVEDRVDAGENSGSSLKHVNVVREFQVAQAERPEGSVNLTIPSGLQANEFHVVAFLQSSADADVRAATSSKIGSKH